MSKYPAGIARMNDYVGRSVKLTRQICTGRGFDQQVFVKGSEGVVTGHYRGELKVKFEYGRVSNLPRRWVKLLPTSETEGWLRVIRKMGTACQQ